MGLGLECWLSIIWKGRHQVRRQEVHRSLYGEVGRR